MQGWLTGWKPIANYIGRSVKTAKMYAKQYGLPVRRLPSPNPNTMGPPVALAYELDQWLINFNDIKSGKIKIK